MATVHRIDDVLYAAVADVGCFPVSYASFAARHPASLLLQEEIGIVERRLMERVKLHPDYALLNSVPGIGPVLATLADHNDGRSNAEVGTP
ncbi:hypothetical protein [Paraburkholderia elongata]|uniref:hypothetical protein n=1 Tax=Paraburkholderia elongata TaxID=2675747 RepID=UPI001F15C492|nr:hypothetical protein [Paraburkholderia elongata]